MANKITNTDHYSAIANAIRAKNGETDTYTPAEMADAIGRIPKGGGASEGDVTFYDYDGTAVETFTADEFAELTEMPEDPDHTDEGLTSQGWNWSLANAKAYVANYGKLNIGQMYVPTDGKTHVFINIPANDPSYETTLYFGHTTASGQTVIDWGDGAPTETASGSSSAEHSHTYANPGRYEVTLDTTTGVMNIAGTNSNKNGTHFYGNGGYARNLTRIEKIIFSNRVSIGANVFSYCLALQSVTIPEGVTSIGGGAFSSCYALQSVTIPEGMTNIGDNAFSYCYALQSVTIPEGMTNIGTYAFSYCYAIVAFYFKRNTPPTLSNTNAFVGISTDTVFYVPAASLDAYKTANNWSTYADRMVAEPE